MRVWECRGQPCMSPHRGKRREERLWAVLVLWGQMIKADYTLKPTRENSTNFGGRYTCPDCDVDGAVDVRRVAPERRANDFPLATSAYAQAIPVPRAVRKPLCRANPASKEK
eukprot:scaffold50194_cov74-Phaeocystis_antarctica.AAC.3